MEIMLYESRYNIMNFPQILTPINNKLSQILSDTHDTEITTPRPVKKCLEDTNNSKGYKKKLENIQT